MFSKRVVIFSGHYGSGKTNIAVNYAAKLKNLYDKVSIYDLDIVNPYFRTVDAESFLNKNGVELIVSPYAETNVDIPAMNAASYKMVHDKSRRAVIDLGGDDRGALALGRFRDEIIKENNYEMVFVFNAFRPETRTLDGALEIMQEIELAAKMKFTSIVNNSNLGIETDEKTLLEGKEKTEELIKATNLKLLFSSVREDLADKIKDKNVLPLSLIEYGKWL